MAEPIQNSDSGLDGGDRPALARTAAIVLALAITLLSVNAIWGLTSSEDTTLSAWLRNSAPLPVWVGVGFVVSGGVAVTGVLMRRRSLLALGLLLATYLAGVLVSRYAYDWLDPQGGVPFKRQTDLFPALWERSFMLWPAIPMLAVYLYFLRDRFPETLRWGTWTTPSGAAGERRPKRTWITGLAAYVVLLIIPATWMMQSAADYEPITSGALFVFIVPVLAMCLFNGFTEEVLFRGLFQPGLCAAAGRWPGIVLQGLFFGFHHWGASPDLIAGLPMAVAASALGMLWGYSVLRTGGMGWAICAHALADFAFFSANFV